jgi:hypothetical protein
MPTGGYEVEIHADPAAVFALTQDYEHRLCWDPFLKEARLLGEAGQAAVGVRACCVARSGWRMETEYNSLKEPEVAAVKMTRGPWYLDRFASTWRFRELARGITNVSFRFHLRVRPWWLRPLLTPIVMASFSRETRKRLVALKRTIETQGLMLDTVVPD